MRSAIKFEENTKLVLKNGISRGKNPIEPDFVPFKRIFFKNFPFKKEMIFGKNFNFYKVDFKKFIFVKREPL